MMLAVMILLEKSLIKATYRFWAGRATNVDKLYGLRATTMSEYEISHNQYPYTGNFDLSQRLVYRASA